MHEVGSNAVCGPCAFTQRKILPTVHLTLSQVKTIHARNTVAFTTWCMCIDAVLYVSMCRTGTASERCWDQKIVNNNDDLAIWTITHLVKLDNFLQ